MLIWLQVGEKVQNYNKLLRNKNIFSSSLKSKQCTINKNKKNSKKKKHKILSKFVIKSLEFISILIKFSQIGGRCTDPILGSSTVHLNFRLKIPLKLLSMSSFGLKIGQLRNLLSIINIFLSSNHYAKSIKFVQKPDLHPKHDNTATKL